MNMSRFNNEEVLEMLQILAAQDALKVSVVESGKNGLLVGCAVVAGGLLGGPIGIAVGGTVGSLTAAYYARNKFRSVVDILKNDLTPAQKNKLVNNISVILSRIRPEDYVSLLTLVLTTAGTKELIIKELGLFFLNELNSRIMQ